MLQFNIESTANEVRTWLNGQIPSTIALRWPSKLEVGVRRVTAGIPVALGESAAGEMSIFAAADDSLLAKALSFRRDGEGSAARYIFFFDLDTDELTPKFTANAALKKIAAVGEIRIRPGDGTDEIVVNDIPFEIRRSRMAGETRIPLASSQTKQSGMIRLAEGDDFGTIAFSQEMVGVPVVGLSLLSPAGSPLLDAVPYGEVTATSFSYRISDDTPNGDYWLFWTAEILTDAENAIIPGTATRNVQSTALAQGEDTVTITFDPALTGSPIIRSLSVTTPEGSPPLTPYPVSLTAESLIVRLSDAPANANYTLNSNVEVA
jgi:hypothetical protein